MHDGYMLARNRVAASDQLVFLDPEVTYPMGKIIAVA